MRVVRLLPWVLAAVLGGLIALGTSLPAHLPDTGSQHIYWYMGRSSGFAAYWLLLASVVLGLAVSSRVFDGWLVRPWVYEMHQFLSLYVLIAMSFHALIMLPDPYAQFSLAELLVPFASTYRPVAVAIGAIALYGSFIVSASFYLKRYIGQQAWRWLHYSTFGLFVLAMVHGILAGTDSGEQWAQLSYLSSGLTVLFFTFFRILASKRAERAAKREPKPAPPAVEGAPEAAAAA
ncbi:MAG: hypothetical protein WEE64_05395 [Dehalococcoidia bacterium]